MYEIPSREDVGKCVIDGNVILGEGEPALIAKDEIYEEAGANETA